MRALLLLLLFFPTAQAWSQAPRRPSPSAEVAWLASQLAASGGAELSAVATNTSVNLIRDRAWIVSAWVGDLPAYDAEYFVLTWLDGKLIGERLTGPGETRVLEGEALARYLATVGLETTPLERVFAELYCDPPRPPPAEDG